MNYAKQKKLERKLQQIKKSKTLSRSEKWKKQKEIEAKLSREMSDAEKRKRQAEEFKGKADYYKEVGNERAFAEYNDSYLQSEAGAAGARYFAARSRAENKNLTKKEREKNEKKLPYLEYVYFAAMDKLEAFRKKNERRKERNIPDFPEED